MLATLKAFGWRNVAFLVLTGLLFVFALLLESTSNSSGPDRGAGYMVGMAIWALASLALIGTSIVLLITGLSNKRPVSKEIVGIALPFVVVAVVLGLEPLFA